MQMVVLMVVDSLLDATDDWSSSIESSSLTAIS